MKKQNENGIVLYQDEDGVTRVSARLADYDLWLTQNQIAEIYDTTQQNISLHIDGILKDGELSAEATHKKYLLVQTEGKRQVKREISHYNLDMFIAIGYRVQSQIATRFRITKDDVKIAKNYLSEIELQRLNLLVSQFLDFAEFQALEQKPMAMQDWIVALDKQIVMLNRSILEGHGKISHTKAVQKAEKEFEVYRAREMKQFESDFDRVVKMLANNAGEGDGK